MSIQDGNYEVYITGYSNMDYPSKRYYHNQLIVNGFNLCANIENADFILLEISMNIFDDAIRAKEYADVNCIEIANSFYDLCKLRDENMMKGLV